MLGEIRMRVEVLKSGEVPWHASFGDSAYPKVLGKSGGPWNVLHAIGKGEVLNTLALGLICSVQCPGSIIIKTLDAIRELRDAGITLVGGFHSPMERECLDFLLRGKQPVIVCPAKGLGRPRVSLEWRKAIDQGRLLLASPFADSIRRTTKVQAHTRNQFIAALATAVLIPHASPGGKAEAIAREIVAVDKLLFTFDDPENQTLLALGARPYNIDEVRSVLTNSNRSNTVQTEQP